MRAIKAGIGLSDRERGAGTSFNDLFAVAENSVKALCPNCLFRYPLLTSPIRSLTTTATTTLQHTLRQCAQHRHSHHLLRSLLVPDRHHRRRRRHRGRRRRHAPGLREVVERGKAAECRLKSLRGRGHAHHAAQPHSKSASIHAHLRMLASSSSSGGGRFGRE